MNTTFRTGFATATAAAAFFAMTACGTEVAPPAQDIGGTVEQDRKTPDNRNRTGNRMDFDDDYGTAERRAQKTTPAGSGTRNRMDFGDEG